MKRTPKIFVKATCVGNNKVFIHQKTGIAFDKSSLAYGQLNQKKTEIVDLTKESIEWLDKMDTGYESKIYWDASELEKVESCRCLDMGDQCCCDSGKKDVLKVRDLKTGRIFLISRWRISNSGELSDSEDEFTWESENGD